MVVSACCAEPAASPHDPPLLHLADQTYLDFSPEGILSGGKGYEFRPQQQELAVAVARALEGGSSLLAEAGTGVGKSLAYVIPAVRFALEHGRKAIISTHTINLQEQLFGKDIPTAAKALGLSFRAALLKGRSNYLCFTRLRRALEQADELFNQEETRQLYDLKAWAQHCGEGSLSELPAELRISRKVWAQVCSENLVCTLRNCGPNCPYLAARHRVEEADVVVLNHTLFFSLLNAVNDDEQPEDEPDDEDEPDFEDEPRGFLFRNDFVVLDEAHTIENVAAHQFGLTLSESELRYDLLRLYNPRTRKGSLRHAASPHLLELIEEAQTAADEFFAQARKDSGLEEKGGEVRLRHPHWTEDILSPSLTALAEKVVNIAEEVENDIARAELIDTAARLMVYCSSAREIISLEKRDNSVYWAETAGQEGQYTTLRSAIINVAPLLRKNLFERQLSCICTSATLSAGDMGIGYFAGRVGGESAATLKIGSPFNFAEQMRVVVARSMPPPPPASTDEEYRAALFEWICRALHGSNASAFVLFTGYSIMRAMAERLRPICVEQGWPLLVQGDEYDRTQMLRLFRKQKGSVLLGTDSFWTGVDVPGDALSHVILTKLPFESPGNPLVEARIDDIRSRGGAPFFDYSLPEAILKYRQGVGRLIRSHSDTGIITLLDSRLTRKKYGDNFLRALPAGAQIIFS